MLTRSFWSALMLLLTSVAGAGPASGQTIVCNPAGAGGAASAAGQTVTFATNGVCAALPFPPPVACSAVLRVVVAGTPGAQATGKGGCNGDLLASCTATVPAGGTEAECSVAFAWPMGLPWCNLAGPPTPNAAGAALCIP